jgi:hypothetical protein
LREQQEAFADREDAPAEWQLRLLRGIERGNADGRLKSESERDVPEMVAVRQEKRSRMPKVVGGNCGNGRWGAARCTDLCQRPVDLREEDDVVTIPGATTAADSQCDA